MKLSLVAAVVLATATFVRPAAGQSQATPLDVDPPVLVGADQPPIPLDDPLQQAPAPSPPTPFRLARQGERIEPGSAADQYRTTVKTLAVHKHQFVHCKLQNGKVLTGLVRNINDQGFSIHTNAVGGTYIHYTALAEPPRVVPAVGTRIKQGAQWTGIGVGIAVAIPLLIPLCLVIYPLIAAGVIQD